MANVPDDQSSGRAAVLAYVSDMTLLDTSRSLRTVA
jgi:acyl-CoA thioesterase